jgi:hypothetical protein
MNGVMEEPAAEAEREAAIAAIKAAKAERKAERETALAARYQPRIQAILNVAANGPTQVNVGADN